MRHNYVGLLAIGTLVLAASSFAADQSPYEAVVLEHGAEVRAGPGQRFYVTQELEPGTRVEVYRREAGDWLAIRPPEGSFSWIPQADLEMTDEPGIAEITSEEAKSWLGSRAERIKEHKSHVTLSRGERVEVLGKKQVEGADGKTQLWLKIAPPAGEFRWVQSRQVRKAKKGELASKDGLKPVERTARESLAPMVTEEPPARRQRIPRSNISLKDLRQEKPEPSPQVRREEPSITSDESTLFPVRPVVHEEPVLEPPPRSLSPDGFVPRKRHPSAPPASQPSPIRQSPAATSSNSSPRIASASTSTASPASAAADSNVARELDDLDLQLSLILSRDRSSWDFSSLKQRVQRIVDTAATPGDRGQARFMLDKIKRFEEAFDVQSLPETKPASPPASRDFRTYDGEGWLTTVKSADKPVAPYALVDAGGKRICFVSPAPGLGVSSHVGKRVGLYGKRGLIADLNEPHVLASKVVDLDRLR